MDRVDCVVIGAGVVGLACARSLATAGRDVVILDREAAFGTGISARNSEVIHGGLYYPPGSLKARLCVAGRRQLYAWCEARRRRTVRTERADSLVGSRADWRAGVGKRRLVRHPCTGHRNTTASS